MAPTTALARFGMIASPHPARPSSVVTRTNIQRGGTRKVVMSAIELMSGCPAEESGEGLACLAIEEVKVLRGAREGHALLDLQRMVA